MEKGTILIVDDNKGVLASLELLLETEFSEIKTAHHPNQIMSILNTSPVDVIILDMNFSAGINNGNEGLYWLKRIREIAPALPVVMLTAYGDVELAVRTLKNDATDFLLKPWDNRTLVCKIKEAFGSGKKRKNRVPDRSQSPMIVGTSPAMQQLMKMVVKVARTDANILITGENGTGKDLIARYVYEQSPRKNEIYVPIDLGSIPDTLFESELFGYEKGAFTDARKNKPGRVEVASGGTLFLNEIGNLSLPLQAKLLSVIEQRKSSRLGSTTSYPVDVRLICATNTDLYSAIDDGQFRQDLLYRINTIEIRIPPLRERGNDLFLLADFFLQRYRKKYKKELRGISKEARKTLQLYRWPGNVRELEHAIERAVILSTGTMLTPDDFMLRSPRSSNTVSEKDKYNLERMEKDAINEVMRMCGGNITLAAEMLGITRTSLYRRIEKFGL